MSPKHKSFKNVICRNSDWNYKLYLPSRDTLCSSYTNCHEVFRFLDCNKLANPIPFFYTILYYLEKIFSTLLFPEFSFKSLFLMSCVFLSYAYCIPEAFFASFEKFEKWSISFPELVKTSHRGNGFGSIGSISHIADFPSKGLSYQNGRSISFFNVFSLKIRNSRMEGSRTYCM